MKFKKSLYTAGIILFLLIVLSFQTVVDVPAPHQQFVSDGCTMFPDGAWRNCCVEHDRDYWWGGNMAARQASDQRLRQCVNEKGYPRTAALMYVGTRVAGLPILPMPWRWGFGLPYLMYPTYEKQVRFLMN